MANIEEFFIKLITAFFCGLVRIGGAIAYVQIGIACFFLTALVLALVAAALVGLKTIIF